MNKTLRSSSLPHLKSPLQSMFNRLTHTNMEAGKQQAKQQLYKVGSYLINKKQLLGRGFCSQVYKARHSQTGLNVAIKLIEFGKVKGKIEKRLLKNQIKNWNQIKNQRNILKLQEIITTKQHVAFVSQLCNQNLLEILRPNKSNKKQPLKYERSLKIIKQIISGYSSMKRHNILHRDIKPANILINQNGQACLADFGFAIKRDEAQKDCNVNVGSPLYMAPQVLRGNHYSSKADVWAIGLIFLEMLNGDLPWIHEKESNLYNQLRQIDIKQIIPASFEEKHRDFLQKCLEFDPRKRIGVRQMMEYFYTQEQIEKMQKCQNLKSKDLVNMNEKIIENQCIKKDQVQINQNLFKEYRLNPIAPKQTFYKNPSCKKPYTSRDLFRTLKPTQSLGNKDLIGLKLNLKGSREQQATVNEQMSEIHFCRFTFKMIQLIIKGKENIHYTYLEISHQILLQLAETILYTFKQIKQAKFDLKSTTLKQFKKTKQFRKILQLTNQYENNYRQYFQIQLNTQLQANQISLDCLRQVMLQVLSKGKQHFQLIFLEVEKSKLKIINDQQISQFSYLIAFIARFVSLLKLKKKDRQIVIKYSKIEQLSNQNSFQSITLTEMRNIYEKLQT